MRSQSRFLALAILLLVGSASYGATVTGTVKGTDGAPFRGAFVEAQNTKNRITVIVLSDTQGGIASKICPLANIKFRSEPSVFKPIRGQV